MNNDRFQKMITLLEEFRIKGIRKEGGKLESVLAFQDIIGMSTSEEIREMWVKSLSESNKRLFLWAVTCTCGFDAITNIIDLTIGKDSKKRVLDSLKEEMDHLDEESIKLANAKNAFEEEKYQTKLIQNKFNQILAIIGK